ncbi:hypothetical protein GGF32_008715 [Allomyces javanicus]|nr:hypothetical protein GGF32_008715 [Allomyces javanicus]
MNQHREISRQFDSLLNTGEMVPETRGGDHSTHSNFFNDHHKDLKEWLRQQKRGTVTVTFFAKWINKRRSQN